MSLATLFRKKPIAEIQRDAEAGFGDEHGPVSGELPHLRRTLGVVDLTAHVDFQAMANAAESMGAKAHGPLLQGEFLLRLGIESRAAALRVNATPDQTLEIDSALVRLTDMSRTGMGEMFKVMALATPALTSLPGFER